MGIPERAASCAGDFAGSSVGIDGVSSSMAGGIGEATGDGKDTGSAFGDTSTVVLSAIVGSTGSASSSAGRSAGGDASGVVTAGGGSDDSLAVGLDCTAVTSAGSSAGLAATSAGPGTRSSPSDSGLAFSLPVTFPTPPFPSSLLPRLANSLCTLSSNEYPANKSSFHILLSFLSSSSSTTGPSITSGAITGDEGADSYRVEVLDTGLFSGSGRLVPGSGRAIEGTGGADAISYPGGGEFGIGGCS
jgi:hypothetical protein